GTGSPRGKTFLGADGGIGGPNHWIVGLEG
ncbi:uncharacterized protein METZ01_LOCUS68136, partial [marine metagenome]